MKRGHLNVPVIGVANSGWNLGQFRERVSDSLEHHGAIDNVAFDQLRGLLRCLDGDYRAPTTYQSIRRELGSFWLNVRAFRRPESVIDVVPVRPFLPYLDEAVSC